MLESFLFITGFLFLLTIWSELRRIGECVGRLETKLYVDELKNEKDFMDKTIKSFLESQNEHKE